MQHRISVTIAAMVVALAAWTPPASAEKSDLPHLPPLTQPATDLELPGKFVWADLFSTDMAAARDFYTALFGWEWHTVSTEPRPYAMFYKDGVAVGGLANRESPKEGQAHGTWVHYASVPDVATTEAAFVERGGKALLPRRSMPDRGDFAILADPDGAIVGAMRSSSGDPEDYQAAIGEFMWFELFTRDLLPSAEFYQTMFGYDIYQREDTPEIVDYLLSSDGYARAGIGALPKDSDSVPTWLGYIRVEDVAQTVDTAIKLGGKVLLPPSPDTLDGGLAIIADPEGTPVGLLQWTYAKAQEASQ
jgi:predicted enzyme related to lactoylglutathione lyase